MVQKSSANQKALVMAQVWIDHELLFDQSARQIRYRQIPLLLLCSCVEWTYRWLSWFRQIIKWLWELPSSSALPRCLSLVGCKSSRLCEANSHVKDVNNNAFIFSLVNSINQPFIAKSKINQSCSTYSSASVGPV